MQLIKRDKNIANQQKVRQSNKTNTKQISPETPLGLRGAENSWLELLEHIQMGKMTVPGQKEQYMGRRREYTQPDANHGHRTTDKLIQK